MRRNKMYTLVIHGGAGSKKELSPEREETIKDILETGKKMLKSGAEATDVVEKCIKMFENSSYFNAGRGAVYNSKGQHTLEAGIMNGRTLKCGAISYVSHVKNPISLARVIMDHTEYCMVVGRDAESIAEKLGLEMVDESYYVYRPHHLLGTVGCVARDIRGNLAAGTSSGGMPLKNPGRVGDSPLIGSGTYANRFVAVSCTGYGEDFIRNQVAYQIFSRYYFAKQPLPMACRESMRETFGGVIAVDYNGTPHVFYNTPALVWGIANKDKIRYGS